MEEQDLKPEHRETLREKTLENAREAAERRVSQVRERV